MTRVLVALGATEAAGAAAFGWMLWQQTGRAEYAVARAFLLALGLGLTNLGLLTWTRAFDQRARSPRGAFALWSIGSVMLVIAVGFCALVVLMSLRAG